LKDIAAFANAPGGTYVDDEGASDTEGIVVSLSISSQIGITFRTITIVSVILVEVANG
jgi:hypothetical protein